MRDDMQRYWAELAGIMTDMPFDALEQVADLLVETYRRQSTVFVLGNGGSAATASHLACDLSKGTRIEGLAPFRVVPLTDNVPLLTAWANDTSYAEVFAAQLTALVRHGDLVVVISASGNSPNVLAAARVARTSGAAVVALTGSSGGRLRHLSDIAVRVPAGSIEQTEDLHLVMAHSLCVALRGRLRAEAKPKGIGLQSADDALVAPAVGAL